MHAHCAASASDFCFFHARAPLTGICLQTTVSTSRRRARSLLNTAATTAVAVAVELNAISTARVASVSADLISVVSSGALKVTPLLYNQHVAQQECSDLSWHQCRLVLPEQTETDMLALVTKRVGHLEMQPYVA